MHSIKFNEMVNIRAGLWKSAQFGRYQTWKLVTTFQKAEPDGSELIGAFFLGRIHVVRFMGVIHPLTQKKSEQKKRCLVCNAYDHRVTQKTEKHKLLRCVHCGFVWVDPQPSFEEYMDHHRNSFRGYNIRDFYLARGAYFRTETRLKSRRVNFVAGLYNSIGKIRILDVGTGQGLFPILARERLRWEAYATEINKEEVDFLNNSKSVKCWFGDLTDLPLPASFFDIVTIWHVLEHTRNPLATLQAVIKILRPHGLCVIAVPNVSSFDNLLRLKLGVPLFSPSLQEWHLFHFTPKTLMAILRKAGFSLVNVVSDLHQFSTSVHSMTQFTKQTVLYVLNSILPVSRRSAIAAIAYKE
jgi:2-polyprenyl-3-methyl-5-hydroxy-6-metoxy-1,4-benzoquinol methylase